MKGADGEQSGKKSKRTFNPFLTKIPTEIPATVPNPRSLKFNMLSASFGCSAAPAPAVSSNDGTLAAYDDRSLAHSRGFRESNAERPSAAVGRERASASR